MANLATIDAITMFHKGTRAEWNNVNIPVPDGMLVIDYDTTGVKRGDGQSLYADLSELFRISDLVTIFDTLSTKADRVHTHDMSAISDLVSLTRESKELFLEADGRSVVVPWTLTDLTNIDVTIGVRQHPSSLTLVNENTIRLGTAIVPRAKVLVERWYLKPLTSNQEG